MGYARVSSNNNNIDMQISALQNAGAEKIYKEKISGKNIVNRNELKKLLVFLREKDVLIVDSLDRLGRNYDDIIKLIQYLDNKDISLIVLNLPILNKEVVDPNLQKLIRNLIIELLSWTSHNEREEIKRKQRQGIELAKQKGHYKGRPIKYAANAKNPKDRMIYNAIVNRLEQDEAIKRIAEDTGVARDTVYRIKNEIKDRND